MGKFAALWRWPAVVLIIIATSATWRLLDLQRSAHMQTLIDREVDFTRELMMRDLQAHYVAISHKKHMWQRGAPPNLAEFRADADEHMEYIPGLLALGFADQNFVVRYVLPADKSFMEGRSIAEIGPDRRGALELARDSRETSITDPVELEGGDGTGFLMVIPLFHQDVFHGTLVAVFQIQTWLNRVFYSPNSDVVLPHLALRMSINGTPVFESSAFQPQAVTHEAKVDAPFQDAVFTIEAQPKPQFYTDHWHWAPESLAAIVLLALSALTGLITLLRRARIAEGGAQAAAFELMGVNETLREEAIVRRRAEAEAKDAREATARFLATMSHEIRTPLNAIMGMFQLINASESLPEKQRKHAAMGIEAARRLHRDLSNVLDVSRLDAGALRVEVTETDLHQLIFAWQTALEGFVIRSEKQIGAHVEIDENLPSTASVDASALTQVVNNLMDNAVKFTERGTVSLSVSALGNNLHVTVSDTGLGIAPARRASIFQRFYQVEEGLERRFSGTGLGLAITHDLVGLMQGTIEVRPNTPKGTVFEVTLPDAFAYNAPFGDTPAARDLARPEIDRAMTV